MLKNYLASLPMNRLARLMYKADKQFWMWANRYFNGDRNPDDGYRYERWRSICDAIYEEMYCEERIKRND